MRSPGCSIRGLNIERLLYVPTSTASLSASTSLRIACASSPSSGRACTCIATCGQGLRPLRYALIMTLVFPSRIGFRLPLHACPSLHGRLWSIVCLLSLDRLPSAPLGRATVLGLPAKAQGLDCRRSCYGNLQDRAPLL